MTPTIVQTVVDAVFAELEAVTAARPLLSFAVEALHQLADAAMMAKVAAAVSPPAAA